MCGIAGIFAYSSGSVVEEKELLACREAMVARGPDGSGAWISPDGDIGLASRRLSIIDLTDAGAQPMATEDESLRLVFNGEIYNYRALRSDLEARGHRFRSDSDTEVLLHLYRERGQNMVHDLRGMYAFALWDDKKNGLLLVRDPFGIKPLYYADDGSSIRFASQVKALLKAGRPCRIFPLGLCTGALHSVQRSASVTGGFDPVDRQKWPAGGAPVLEAFRRAS